jgi:hypothetical protein
VAETRTAAADAAAHDAAVDVIHPRGALRHADRYRGPTDLIGTPRRRVTQMTSGGEDLPSSAARNEKQPSQPARTGVISLLRVWGGSLAEGKKIYRTMYRTVTSAAATLRDAT